LNKFLKKQVINIFFVWASTILNSLLAFITQVILARSLTVSSYGLLAASLGFIALLLPLAGFGISSFWLKSFGKEGSQASRWLKPSMKFLLLTILLLLIAVHLWAYLGPNEATSRTLILILVWTILGTVSINIVSTKYQLEDNFFMYSLLQIMPVGLKTIAVVIIVNVGIKGNLIVEISDSYLLITIFICSILYSRIISIWKGKINPAGHHPNSYLFELSNKISIIDVFHETKFFGILGILYLAWNQGHIVIAKYFLGDSDAGIYNSAMIIITTVSLLPSVAYSKFLQPRIHRWAYKDLVKLKRMYNYGNKIMFVVGICAMLLLIFSSSWLITIIFGEKYNEASTILIILALTLPFRFLGYSSGALLMTAQYQKIKAKVLFIVVLLNLILAYVIIPIWGLVGLASTIAMSELILVSFYYFYVHKYYFTKVTYK